MATPASLEATKRHHRLSPTIRQVDGLCSLFHLVVIAFTHALDGPQCERLYRWRVAARRFAVRSRETSGNIWGTSVHRTQIVKVGVAAHLARPFPLVEHFETTTLPSRIAQLVEIMFAHRFTPSAVFHLRRPSL